MRKSQGEEWRDGKGRKEKGGRGRQRDEEGGRRGGDNIGVV